MGNRQHHAQRRRVAGNGWSAIVGPGFTTGPGWHWVLGLILLNPMGGVCDGKRHNFNCGEYVGAGVYDRPGVDLGFGVDFFEAKPKPKANPGRS